MTTDLTNSELKHSALRLIKHIDRLVMETPTGDTRTTLTDAVIVISELVKRLPK